MLASQENVLQKIVGTQVNEALLDIPKSEKHSPWDTCTQLKPKHALTNIQERRLWAIRCNATQNIKTYHAELNHAATFVTRRKMSEQCGMLVSQKRFWKKLTRTSVIDACLTFINLWNSFNNIRTQDNNKTKHKRMVSTGVSERSASYLH